MAGFLKIKMSSIAGKGLVASFILFFVGIGFTVYHVMFGTGTATPPDVTLMCLNEDCDYTDVLSPDESLKLASEHIARLTQSDPEVANQLVEDILHRLNDSLGSESGATRMSRDQAELLLMQEWGSVKRNLPFTCPKCGQASVFKAIQCENENCGNFFLQGSSKGYVDSCPKCGYSKRELAIKSMQKNEKK